MNVILVSTTEELKSFLDNHNWKRIYNKKIPFSKIFNKNKWLIVQSNVGLVNMAITASSIFSNYDVKYCFKVGAVGASSSNLKIFDTILINKGNYLIADSTYFNYKIGQIPCEPFQYYTDQDLNNNIVKVFNSKIKFFYSIGSSDIFLHKNNWKIIEKYPKTDVVDMESVSLMQTCLKFQIKCSIISVVSDYIYNLDPKKQYNLNIQKTSYIIMKIINKLNTKLVD